MILQASHDFGVTSVVISHDMASTFRIADKISMLYEGKIMATGTSAELLQSKFAPLREFIDMAGLSREPERRAP